jgi:glycosyltransferase involved in cell wall biosynthesis
VWTADVPLRATTVRFERYLAGFEALGHEAVMVSTARAAEGFDRAGVTVPALASLRDPALWASLGLDAALVVTWLVGRADVLTAMRPHVGLLLSLTDSDGVVGVRVFPRMLFGRMWWSNRRFRDRVGAAGWWLRQYLGMSAGIDREVLAGAALTDRLVVYSPGAARNLRSFLEYHGASELGARVMVAPYPVADDFERLPVSARREDQVVAIGRWWDPQKDAPLLAATIRRYLQRGGRWRFVVIGCGGTELFGPLERQYPGRVVLRGVVPPAEVADVLGRSNVLLSTSRWESGPIVASEALLRGCSLVGPSSIPSFCHFSRDGEYGTTFAARTAGAVAEALVQEEGAWARRAREPATIAGAWQGCFTPATVCRQLLEGLDTAPVRCGGQREGISCSPGSGPRGLTRRA